MRGGNHMDNQLPELKVNMLGRFSITYGEQPITFKRNSATKAVKLLQILLHSSLVEDRGSTGIPRAQLLDDLFGREELANVGNNLRVTVFRLRKMLIEAGLPEYEYIVKEKGVFYWRSPMKVDLDVARFMELVREGEEEVDETRKMNLWEKACRLYKGELLPMQSGEDWVIMNSVRYKDKYSKILRRLCAYRKEQHEYDTILELTDNAIEIYPFDEWQSLKIDALMLQTAFGSCFSRGGGVKQIVDGRRKSKKKYRVRSRRKDQGEFLHIKMATGHVRFGCHFCMG